MKKIGRLDRPYNTGSAKMFDNPLLERISRTHISIPITMFFVFAGISLYYGITTTVISWPLAIGLFLVGYITFTFVEYMMHKHFFHMEPDTPMKDKLQYSVHGVHHDYPKDKDRLAMPPFVSAAYAAIASDFQIDHGQLCFLFPSWIFGWLCKLLGGALHRACLQPAQKLPEDSLGQPCHPSLQGSGCGFRSKYSALGLHPRHPPEKRLELRGNFKRLPSLRSAAAEKQSFLISINQH